MGSKADPVEGTFDIDVVGLTDLTEFKPEVELYDFDSGGDFGLFGEKDFYTFGASSNSITLPENLPRSVVTPRRKKPNKNWNETEKDLFLKGLEMFGENWRKISKFIATKSPYQVKIYYKVWSQTANVIHDSEHRKNNPCIYLPDLSEPRPSEAGDELFISYLHDWSLGSQVSVTEEIASEPSFEHEPFYAAADRALDLNETTLRNAKNNLKFSKKKQNVEDRMKLQTKELTANKILIQEQIIHISKNDDEENDVNIESSDDDGNKNGNKECDINIEDSDDEDTYVTHGNANIYSANINEVSKSNDKVSNINVEHSPRSASKSLCLSDVEMGFCTKILGTEKINEFCSLKNHILKVWGERNCFSYEPITLPEILLGCDDSQISNRDVSKIFYFLEKQRLFNYEIPVGSAELENDISPLKRNQSQMEQGKRKKRKTMKQLNGGVTVSHDAFGLVENTLHVPERNCRERRKTTPIKLLRCLQYKHGRQAPFSTIIHPSALILLDIHAHSSYSEVMGLLGGFLDLDNQILYIATAVSTKAATSNIECDMCPFAQQEASQRIHEMGMEVIGWYHSHPTFLPNPSEKDLESQSQLQRYFQRQNLPFVGLIISPFCAEVFSGASLLCCVVLDKLCNSQEKLVPFSLAWKVNNEFDIEYDDIESPVLALLVQIDSHSKSNNWSKEYKNGISFANKLCRSLLAHIPQNLKRTIHLVKNILCSKL